MYPVAVGHDGVEGGDEGGHLLGGHLGELATRHLGTSNL